MTDFCRILTLRRVYFLQGNNAIFSIELLQGEDAAVFSVSPSSAAGSANVHLVVEEPRFLDYEKFAYRSHIFRVRLS